MPTRPKPGYYAVLKASVRYDADLPPNAKLMFAEITALCDMRGYCTATNKYFADLYGVTSDRVSRWIGLLVEKGYVEREIVRDPDTMQVTSRKLRLTDAIPPVINKGTPPGKIVGTPPGKNNETNNSSLNNSNLSSIDLGPVDEKPISKDHPAIKALKEVTGKIPPKAAWSLLADCVGETPDLDRLKSCFAEWSMAGYRDANFNWVRDWYAKPDPGKPVPEQQDRLDYPMVVKMQEYHEKADEWFHDLNMYEVGKDNYLQNYKDRPEDYSACLKEIAEYEQSKAYKRRFGLDEDE